MRQVKYKNFTIYHAKRGKWIAQRNDDFHVSPFTYSTLREAKSSIRSGEADLTQYQVAKRNWIAELRQLQSLGDDLSLFIPQARFDKALSDALDEVSSW